VDRDGTEVLTAASPFQFDGMKPAVSTRWPGLGEDGADVIRRWLGSGVPDDRDGADRPTAPIAR
ncbi:MAG: hypothetical protein ACKO40_16955, partial [Planctomycetaceae bacterium]